MYSSLLEQQTPIDTTTDTLDTTTRTTKNIWDGMGMESFDHTSSTASSGSQSINHHHHPPHPHHHSTNNNIHHTTTTTTSMSMSTKINFAGHLLVIKRLLQKSIAEAPAELVHFLGNRSSCQFNAIDPYHMYSVQLTHLIRWTHFTCIQINQLTNRT